MNKKGQGLVEYLILVCLVAVSTIAIVKVVGTNIREQYANVSNAIRGDSGKVSTSKAERSTYQKRGMDDFTDGAHW